MSSCPHTERTDKCTCYPGCGCDPADDLVAETERLGLYDDDPFVSDSHLRYNAT